LKCYKGGLANINGCRLAYGEPIFLKYASAMLAAPPQSEQALNWRNMSSNKIVAPPLDFGIAEADRLKIVEGLSQLLADTYTLYLKTHNFHWNVTGPMFQTLHTMFMVLYNEQWLAIDLVAERIRSLGSAAPGTYEEFTRLTSIKPSKGLPNARAMISELLEGQQTVARTARQLFPIAEQVNDQPTCDLLTQRMQIHEKNAWMLRSLLEE
jgi:starvation-inducible DNA-binding protein